VGNTTEIYTSLRTGSYPHFRHIPQRIWTSQLKSGLTS